MSTTALPGLRSPGTMADERGGKLDLWLIVSAAILLFFGLSALYSIQAVRPGTTFFTRQMVFLAIGVVLFSVARRLDLEKIGQFTPLLYTINLGLLASVFVIGDTRNNATRWIDIGPLQFQPSELAKIFLILTLGTYFASRQGKPIDLKTYVISLVHIAPILLLVYKQPHLGGALCMLVIWLCMSIGAGVRWQYLVATLVIFGTGIGLTMRGYHQERLASMFQSDRRGDGYQQDQSLIAFAEGGITGTGFMKGEQKKMGFIPEQQNDFIFSVVGEEGGLIGGLLVLAAFSFFFYRTWLVSYRSQTFMGRYVSSAILGVLAFHTVVNLAMVTGVGPVVGLWLPFMSYGGTALWMALTCLGLLHACR
jgi:rod shape determining protein RodA